MYLRIKTASLCFENEDFNSTLKILKNSADSNFVSGGNTFSCVKYWALIDESIFLSLGSANIWFPIRKLQIESASLFRIGDFHNAKLAAEKALSLCERGQCGSSIQFNYSECFVVY